MSNFDTERLNIQLVKELKAENKRLKDRVEKLERFSNLVKSSPSNGVFIKKYFELVQDD